MLYALQIKNPAKEPKIKDSMISRMYLTKYLTGAYWDWLGSEIMPASIRLLTLCAGFRLNLNRSTNRLRSKMCEQINSLNPFSNL